MTEFRTGRGCQRGFSLLEVLVAFAILALSLGTLLTFFSTGSRNVSIARDYGRAVIVAESKLAELNAQATLATGILEGDIDHRYRWQAEIADYAPDNTTAVTPGRPRVYRVTLTVSWGDKTDARAVVLTGLRFGNG